MRVPFGWLQDFVKLDVTPEEACAHLITLGFSDAEVVPSEWTKLDDFVAGRALKVSPHPSDPHLKLVKVNIGYTTLVSVCGAPAIEEGANYAVAMPGADLGSGRRVDSAEIGGVLSQCVLCSGWETWIDDSKDELLRLDDEIAPGTKIIEALRLGEPVIEMEVTPNRGDCLGLIGVARELAALFGKELMIPEPSFKETGPDIGQLASVEILAEEACPRYGAIVIEGVKVGSSPAQMRARLRLAGLRPINNVVDATNIVLFETGHPLHAFDLDKIDGAKIKVRMARPGEKIVAIDGSEYDLHPEDLVIADETRPVAIAGIIGGQDCEVTSRTARVLLEGAFFNRTFIWRTTKRLGIDSEAAYRFGRTVDVGAVLYVLARTAAIILGNVPCSIARGKIDVYPNPPAPRHLFVSPKRVNTLLGTSIPEQEICDYLERLGFLVSPGKELEVIVPTRRSDVECEADIAEEVARLYGYDRIDETTRHASGYHGSIPADMQVAFDVRGALTGLGLTEVVTDATIGPEHLERLGMNRQDAVEIRNPVGIQNSLMRTSLVPGIVDVLIRNEKIGQERVAIFEFGKVYLRHGDNLGETYRLAVGLSGLRQSRAWYSRAADFDFYDMKGIFESLGTSVGLDFAFEAGNHAFLHPGRRSAVFAKQAASAVPVGFMGEITPRISEMLGSKRRLYVADIDFSCLIEPATRERRYQELQRYPVVKRDIAVILGKDVPEAAVREAVTAEGGDLIERVNVFDVYEGEQIPAGTKSLAYGIIFRSPTRTLTEQEADDLQQNIENRLIKQFNGKIRTK
jgi:phenylalanyl-tRNA synthetase beta chain